MIPVSGWADVVFSTATFHWVRDHAALFRNVFAALRPGGVLHAQGGGKGNLALARQPAEEVMRSPQFRPWFEAWTPVWEFADSDDTAQRLAAAGFTAIDTSLEASPIDFDDEAGYRAYVSTVVFRLHLAALPPELRPSFLDELVSRVVQLPPRFSLDYVRPNIRAMRPTQNLRSSADGP